MCTSPSLPGISWASSSDLTDPHLGVFCSRVETPLPGYSNKRGWASMWKLIKLIEEL